MRVFLTLFAVCFFSINSFSQTVNEHTIKVTVKTQQVVVKKKKLKKKARKPISRVYLFKNTRIKKELGFRTFKKRPKLV